MYNRKNAINYAHTWWNKRNPNFYNYDNIGGDCTNFISQCLHAGGIVMDKVYNGWFYTNSSNRSYSWTGVEEFFKYATTNQKNVGPKAKVVTISQVEVGDIVQMQQLGKNRFHHNMLITKIDGKKTFDNIKITCHTKDSVDRPLSNYYYQKIRFLKILN